MVKNFLSIIFVLVVLLLTTGCQTKTVAITEIKASEPVVENSIQKASSTPNIDENAIISVLASKNNQDINKYKLHDVKINGDYALGRWSFDGNLSLEMFWAKKENSSWRLVYLGKETPTCEQLSSWPIEIKAGCRDDLNGKQVSNFSQCVEAGGRIENTKLRRCFDKQGNIFVEMMPGNSNKRYISQDLNKCVDLDFDCTIQEKRFMDNLGCGCQASEETR